MSNIIENRYISYYADKNKYAGKSRIKNTSYLYLLSWLEGNYNSIKINNNMYDIKTISTIQLLLYTYCY